MKKAILLSDVSLAKRLAFTALFAALCFVGTYVIQIPSPAAGYFNVGDIFVLLSGWLLGPLYGGVAAAIGSALADLVAFPAYAPVTFFVKGFDAIVAYLVWAFFKKLIKKQTLDVLPRALSALAGEAGMVRGYFAYEIVAFDITLAAAGMVATNLPQATICLVGGIILIAALYPIKSVRNFFPALKREEE